MPVMCLVALHSLSAVGDVGPYHMAAGRLVADMVAGTGWTRVLDDSMCMSMANCMSLGVGTSVSVCASVVVVDRTTTLMPGLPVCVPSTGALDVPSAHTRGWLDVFTATVLYVVLGGACLAMMASTCAMGPMLRWSTPWGGSFLYSSGPSANHWLVFRSVCSFPPSRGVHGCCANATMRMVLGLAVMSAPVRYMRMYVLTSLSW